MLNLRRAAATSTLLLLAPLAACGGGDGGGDAGSAPENASTDEFCTSYNSLYESLMSASPGEGGDQQGAAIQALRDWTEKMRDTGTPDDMPEDARQGFELILDTASDIEADATMEDLQNLGDDLSDSEREQTEAFTTWAQEECPMELPGMDLPTDAPSDAPSDAESETTAP